MLTEDEKQYLKNIYFSPKHEASFGGIDALYRFVRKDGRYKISKKEIQQFLRSIEEYSTHVKKNRPKSWYGMTVPGVRYMYEVDTAHFNIGDGEFRYFVTMIDTFSRKASARAIKDMKSRTVTRAIKEMLVELGSPSILRSDRGVEYVNKVLKNEMKKQKIKQVFSFPPYKASMVERLIRDVKNKLYKILQSKGREDWWTYLGDVIKGHNEGFHRMLNMAPNQVSSSNTPQLWYRFKQRRAKAMPPFKKYKYCINDGVRVSLERTPMHKDHNELNSTNVYFITYRYSRAHVHRYKLKDSNNKALEGSFTENQLELTFVDEQTVWRIERVIHYAYLGTGRNRAKYAYCKWQGMSSKFNSYTLASNVIDLRESDK